jgi:hypothetical protein
MLNASLVSVALMKAIRASAEVAAAKKKTSKAKPKKAAAKKAKRKAVKKSAAATKKAAEAKLKAARKVQSDKITAMILSAAAKPTSKEGFESIVDAVDGLKASAKSKKDKLSSKAVVDGVVAAGKKLAVPAKLKAGTPLTTAMRRAVSIVMDHFIAVSDRERALADKAEGKKERKGKGLPAKKIDAAKAAAVAKHLLALRDAGTDKAKFDAVVENLNKEEDKTLIRLVANEHLETKTRYSVKSATAALKKNFQDKTSDLSVVARIAGALAAKEQSA